MARKKWRIVMLPMLSEVKPGSQVETYRLIDRMRRQREEGLSRCSGVHVYVDEGAGWISFERIPFAESRENGE